MFKCRTSQTCFLPLDTFWVAKYPKTVQFSSVIPFWKAILMYFKVARLIGQFSGHFKWLPWWSGSIYKKWLPRESIEARVLNFCVGLCMTNTHARKKWRLNPRTKIYFDTPYLTTSIVREWVSQWPKPQNIIKSFIITSWVLQQGSWSIIKHPKAS